MTISNSHQRFAYWLGNPDAIEHPENYLGPNWETVINFWKWVDKLSEAQLKVAIDRCVEAYGNSYEEWITARDTARTSSKDVVGVKVSYAAWRGPSYAKRYATLELIAMHDILNQGKTLYFIPMFDNL